MKALGKKTPSNVRLTFKNLCKKVGVTFIVERRIAAQQDVGNDSDAPHVHCFAVRLLGKNFRGCNFQNSLISTRGRRHHATKQHKASEWMPDSGNASVFGRT